MKKIVIAGAGGFIGKYLLTKFRSRGDKVITIGRTEADMNWNDQDSIVKAIDGADIVINLAGKSVDCRYNDKNKQELLRSRVETTTILGESILKCASPPLLWLNASTATIYRHAEDRPMTESSGEIGDGFSVNVALQWEKAFFKLDLPGTRRVALRMAIVLGSTGGALIPLKRLTKFGLGGKQGNGKQMFSWIHIEDLYRIIVFVEEHQQLKGAINCSSPNPVTNESFMRQLRKKIQIKIGIPSPKWLLETGAVIIRTETELILKSRWVLPERLLKAGYIFKYPDLTTALEEILS